jgi:hypothetical protein
MECLGQSGFGEECSCLFHQEIRCINHQLLMENLGRVVEMLRKDEVPEATELLEHLIGIHPAKRIGLVN